MEWIRYHSPYRAASRRSNQAIHLPRLYRVYVSENESHNPNHMYVFHANNALRVDDVRDDFLHNEKNTRMLLHRVANKESPDDDDEAKQKQSTSPC